MEPSGAPPAVPPTPQLEPVQPGRHHLFLFGLHNAPLCLFFGPRASTATTGGRPSRPFEGPATAPQPDGHRAPSWSPRGARPVLPSAAATARSAGAPPSLSFWAPRCAVVPLPVRRSTATTGDRPSRPFGARPPRTSQAAEGSMMEPNGARAARSMSAASATSAGAPPSLSFGLRNAPFCPAH